MLMTTVDSNSGEEAIVDKEDSECNCDEWTLPTPGILVRNDDEERNTATEHHINQKEEDNMGNKNEDKTMYRYWSVIVIDRRTLQVLLDNRVVAKNKEQALGKTGYYDELEKRDYDKEKLAVMVKSTGSFTKLYGKKDE